MKILNYFQFILEAKSEKLLPVVFSSEFIDKVSQIDSPISAKFLQLLKSKALCDYTFIRSGDSVETVKYSDSSRLHRKILQEDPDSSPESIIKSIKFGADHHFFTEDKVEIRIGRFLRKLFGAEFSDSQYEKFINQWISLGETFTFEEWEGWKIIEGYKSTNYHYEEDSNNPLMNSCMNDEISCLEFYSYCKNVKLIVLLNDEKRIVGRALLWTDTRGRKILDRIYYTMDSYYYQFIRHAKQNGWFWKKRNISGGSQFCVDDRVLSLDVTIEVQDIFRWKNDGNLFPYMDSFYYGWSKYVSNNEPDSGAYLKLQDTEGGYEEHNYMYDVHGEQFSSNEKEEYAWSQTQGGYIRIDDSEFVNYSGGSGYPEYKFSDSVELSYLQNKRNGFVEVDDKWYLQKHCVWSESEQTWIFRPDAIWIKNDWISYNNYIPVK